MTESIPKNRLVAYGLILGLIPLGAVVLNFLSGLNDINNQNERIELIQEQALLLSQKQAVNIALMQSYKEADHFYIDKQLETIQLLEPEIEALQTAMNNRNVAEDESLKKRHEHLIGSGNALGFSEGVVQSTPVFQEVVETMIHPVEVNIENLKEILAKVEGVDIGPYSPGPNRPQLIIIDFKMDKKNSIDKNEVFQLNMKLLKREYL